MGLRRATGAAAAGVKVPFHSPQYCQTGRWPSDVLLSLEAFTFVSKPMPRKGTSGFGLTCTPLGAVVATRDTRHARRTHDAHTTHTRHKIR
jgi:hypothetical protein